MRKYIKLIFIYILVLVVFAGCQEKTDPEVTEKPVSTEPTEEVPAAAYESYIISDTQSITHGEEIEYKQKGVVPCKLMRIIMDGDMVSSLEIRFEDNSREVYDLDDIEGKVTTHIDRDDNTIVEIEFYSGGKARYVEGESMYMFVDSEGYYTFDSSKSTGVDIKIYEGEITGFEFLPIEDKKKSIVLEHILVTIDEDTVVNVPIVDSRVESINSKGDIYVDYEGSINDKNVFSINVKDDFGMVLNYKDGSSKTYAMGSIVELEKIDSSTYKIANNFDNGVYKAYVDEFVLRHEDAEVTGMEEIIFTVEDMDDFTMTMMDLGCEYAVPFGNILREYDSIDGSEDVLLSVLPSADFGMELYYDGKARVKLNYEDDVKVFRDFYGEWHIDAY